jgi:hypothetical protein
LLLVVNVAQAHGDFAKLKDFIETYREFPWGVAGVLVQGELTRALL